ncbi:MAG: esterase [Rhizobiales bacterium]|nr:esterase [Hyphomicrobiales bacterium]
MCAALIAASVPLFSTGELSAQEPPPLAIKDFGSFHIGGRVVEIAGKPVKEVALTPHGAPAVIDPNGRYQVEQMYVQHFTPADERGRVPLLMWHGGGLTGVTWETTPDGRPGWLQDFLRRGWKVYNSDAVERGRSGWASPDIFKGDPVFLTVANPFERFRIGEGPGAWNDDPSKRRVHAGSLFPMKGYENFTRQVVPRWTTTDEAILNAYRELVDKVCPCVLVFHSQGGQFGFKVAQEKPDKIKALVAVEPASVGYLGQEAKLKNIPVLMVFGDYIEVDPRWKRMRETAGRFGDAISAAGGNVDIYDLPKRGISGNSHMMMMDSNSSQISGMVDAWLATKQLKR